MYKNIWIVANWKSNKNLQQALEWVHLVGPEIEKRENLKVVVCPDFVDIEEVKKAILTQHYPLLVGAQDLSPFDVGPHTGEEAAQVLSGMVELAILGHSERREQFGETDQMVEKKAQEAIRNKIIPLVCLQSDSTPIPQGVNLVAYEPIFAIGTGNPDTPQDANEVAKSIKLKAPSLEVLYGGSVTSQNAKAFMQQDHLSGLLVGGASLDPQEFVKIIKSSYLL